MSKEGIDDARFSEYLELGKRNSELIPLAKNWCKHLEIIDSSGGLIAEVYNLPTTLSIGCPHSKGGSQAANFEWIATDFIIENCINCKFHSQVSPQNLGIKILDEHKRREREKQAEILALKQSEEKLQQEVDAVISKDHSEASVTTLSILKLVQELGNEDNRKTVAEKIRESAKLSPGFFSQGAVDYLALYIEKEDGDILIHTINILSQTQNCLSPFVIDRVEAALKKGENFDAGVGLLTKMITDKTLVDYHWLFDAALEFCDYRNDYGMREDKQGQYPHSVDLFISLYQLDPIHYNKIISNRLVINDKHTRLNINGLLTDICDKNSAYVEQFTSLLIRSFELKDDAYGSSADHTTRITLRNLYITRHKKVLESITELYEKLSAWARMEILDFYQKIICDEETFSVSESSAKEVIDTLVTLLLKNSPDHKYQIALIDAVERAVDERPSAFIAHFDAFLGYLINANERKLTFIWQRNELNGAGPISTFNALAGKSYLEIHSLEMDHDHILRDSEKIVTSIIKSDPENLFHPVIDMINNLSSKDQQDLKVRLIAVLQSALKDPINISTLLPSIYNFLLDKDSENVRVQGMKFLIHLIDNHPNLVTQTFLDLIQVFVNDNVVSIQIKALEAIGGIFRTYPEQISDVKIDLVLSKLTSKYVYVRVAIIRLCYKLYPFLSKQQLDILIITAIELELYFFDEKDYTKCGEIIDILLYITADTPVYDYVVKKILVKHCDSKEFYRDEKSLAKLTNIAKKHEKFQEVWLEQAIGFLSRSKPDRFNPGTDRRKKLYNVMYEISPQILLKFMSKVLEFGKDRINRQFFMDIIDTYAVLAYYGCYRELATLAEYFETKYQRCAANDGIYELHDLIKETVTIETTVQSGKVDADFIKTLKTYDL